MSRPGRSGLACPERKGRSGTACQQGGVPGGQVLDPLADSSGLRQLPCFQPDAKRHDPASRCITLSWACPVRVRLPDRAARVWSYAG